EQALASGAGQFDDVLAAAPAIGGVRLVAQIDEVPRRKAGREFAVDRQAPHAGVENAYRHAAAFRPAGFRRPILRTKPDLWDALGPCAEGCPKQLGLGALDAQTPSSH